MAELKTKPTRSSVSAFLNGIEDEQRRKDCSEIARIMKRATKTSPRMWGSSVVGFGDYHYKYASGREGDWFITGFSPRKADLTLYFMSGFEGYEDLMRKLGRHKMGKGCLYIKKLADVDRDVLTTLIEKSVRQMERAKKA
jgi:Domain of unknown function (DU1801)